jgi:hypothetical protein
VLRKRKSSVSLDYGWVVVAVGALMTCVAFGSMLSLAVFLQPISQDMGWSRSGVSAAATIDFLAMGWRRSSGARCPTGSAPASWCCRHAAAGSADRREPAHSLCSSS